MRAGRLRHRVTIEQVSEDVDSAGGPIKEWTSINTVWANVRPVRGREFSGAAQVTAEVTHRVFMRYLANLTSADRLVFEGRVFDIESVINIDERNVELEILCTEAV